jgi:hypothetical protein
MKNAVLDTDERRAQFDNLIKWVGGMMSLITAIVCVTLYITSLDKRISVAEDHNVEIETRMNSLRGDFDKDLNYQAVQQQQFRVEVSNWLIRMSDRIEKIYGILIDDKDISVKKTNSK